MFTQLQANARLSRRALLSRLAGGLCGLVALSTLFLAAPAQAQTPQGTWKITVSFSGDAHNTTFNVGQWTPSGIVDTTEAGFDYADQTYRVGPWAYDLPVGTTDLSLTTIPQVGIGIATGTDQSFAFRVGSGLATGGGYDVYGSHWATPEDNVQMTATAEWVPDPNDPTPDPAPTGANVTFTPSVNLYADARTEAHDTSSLAESQISAGFDPLGVDWPKSLTSFLSSSAAPYSIDVDVDDPAEVTGSSTNLAVVGGTATKQYHLIWDGSIATLSNGTGHPAVAYTYAIFKVRVQVIVP
jgi:hypothetical protein